MFVWCMMTCRPRELSSKKPVSTFREIVPIPKKTLCDPRFDERAGSFNEDLFKKSYTFIGEMKKNEKLQVQKELRKTKKPGKKKKLEVLLQKIVSVSYDKNSRYECTWVHQTSQLLINIW